MGYICRNCKKEIFDFNHTCLNAPKDKLMWDRCGRVTRKNNAKKKKVK